MYYSLFFSAMITTIQSLEDKNSLVKFVDRDNIIFPDQYNQSLKIIPKLEGEPSCAKGRRYCEYDDDYPKEAIEELLKTSQDPIPSFLNEEYSNILVNRIAVENEEQSLCQSKTRLMLLNAAKSEKDDAWKWIVSTDGLKQGVLLEACTDPENKCIMTPDLFGYEFYCQQKFVRRRLLAVDVKNGKNVLAYDIFLFPFGCCCTYSRVQ